MRDDDAVRHSADAGSVAGALLIGAAIILLALVFGCASPAQKVLRSVNDYEFQNARYREICTAPVAQCPEKAALLRKWSGALDEAGAALKRGGAFPMQLERLKTIEGTYPK